MASVYSNKVYRLQCYNPFPKSRVTFERAMLKTKIELFFNSLSLFHLFFFQGIFSVCRTTLGEHIRADCQDSQLIALPESSNELSLVSTGYFGSLAHTVEFKCNYIQDQSLNFMKSLYNSYSLFCNALF